VTSPTPTSSTYRASPRRPRQIREGGGGPSVRGDSSTRMVRPVSPKDMCRRVRLSRRDPGPGQLPPEAATDAPGRPRRHCSPPASGSRPARRREPGHVDRHLRGTALCARPPTTSDVPPLRAHPNC
jgi:hypothetical protein